MNEDLFKIASTQGIWAVLSIFLIIYIIKVQSVREQNQNAREENYRNIIKDLTGKLSVLDNINLNLISLINKNKIK
ncbi:MAG: BhlA/UviB family holin-like peptide [Cetobacterium sp.]|uniref:BhlA/UviB family holin-like peptide n=1 Tax=Cetobacterium sp. TaxID=2071632 RepID=UPI002FC98275